MSSNIAGVSGYNQTKQIWNNNQKEKIEKKTSEGKSDTKVKADSKVKVSKWKPISTNGFLVPTVKEGYGTVIGDVTLSEDAQKYYDKLKSKFSGMDFILVSKDLKSQVAANASLYGNANKPVVLIDDEKLERMTTDESYRKKYEGIIALAQTQLWNAKDSLSSNGLNVKSFGMSVASDGTTYFFASVEKISANQEKILEKIQTAKKEERAEAKKKTAKEERKERFEKLREGSKAKKTAMNAKPEEETGYIEFKADTVEDLILMISKYAYDNSSKSVPVAEEEEVGRHFDFRG